MRKSALFKLYKPQMNEDDQKTKDLSFASPSQESKEEGGKNLSWKEGWKMPAKTAQLNFIPYKKPSVGRLHDL